ncbi:hypothetical protein [Hominenteromicrobium sp.]|jgi:hypothetical protein|uniref:hypothetical protein n=1 Tax=Hominenteromicrobium sp. TaxID=3073581 RepID=UPI003995DBDF
MFWYIALLIIIYLTINFIIAKMMENAASLKGYGTNSHAFIMCFLFGLLGCLYVVALPDLVQQNQNKQIIDLLKEDIKAHDQMQ